MGRGTRWLCVLFGRKKADSDGSTAASQPAKEKRRCDLANPSLEQRIGEQSTEATEERKWSHREALRSFVPVEDEEEQNKRAIAVAAATAAVAEAAVAAAQAAAAVVRLTGSGRAAASKREAWAAIKIQAAFRGYLARRALKALKGLVKLQALVRGNIVRKQAAETLRCMQALVRVQARARACRVLRSEISRFEKGPIIHSRASSKSIAADACIWDSTNSGGWNWLDGWMEERYRDSHGSVKKKGNGGPVDDEKNAKILEVDPGIHHKKRTAHNQSYSTLTSDKNSHCFANLPDSPSMESSAALQFASSESSIKLQHSLGHLRFPSEPGDFGESPQLCSASSRPGSSRRGPFTPSKSECSRSLFGGYSDNPNYMANTESSRAKWRSHSAPKQRPDQLNSSGPLAQRFSSLHAKSSYRAYPGSGRLDRFGMPVSIG